nr:MAG TPA: hypothetical protein [Caudoviricetes sp.]
MNHSFFLLNKIIFYCKLSTKVLLIYKNTGVCECYQLPVFIINK